MNIEKRKKCHYIRNQLESTRIALNSALSRMNAENDRAVRLGQEAESLESKALDVARSASLNAVGLGDKKGRFLSAGGLVVDGLDAVKLRQQAKEKRSEQSFAIQSQKRYENEAKGLERKIKNLERRLDRMGCN